MSLENLELDGRGPIYLQIVRFVRRGVVAGTIQDGEEMPSRRAVSALLGVNPNTVQKAYRLLEEEGVLVSRAGSNTLCEILALKKPSLLIPYPKGASRGDQVENAASFAARGLAQVLDQAHLTPESLLAAVRALYASKDELRARMDEEPAANGTKKVLEILEQTAKRG